MDSTKFFFCFYLHIKVALYEQYNKLAQYLNSSNAGSQCVKILKKFWERK